MYRGEDREMKNTVQEIFKSLNIPDAFTRIHLNKHDIEKIEHLLTPFLDSAHNNAPYTSTMVELCKKHDAILECYIVNSDRQDARFSCEGINFKKLDATTMCFIVSGYHNADELSLSVVEDKFNLRLWWD